MNMILLEENIYQYILLVHYVDMILYKGYNVKAKFVLSNSSFMV